MQKGFEKKEETTEEIVDGLQKKHSNKLRSLIIMFSVIGIIIFLILLISAYFYFKSPEKTLGLGANIESVLLSSDGTISYIKLAGGSLDKNITKIKFIFIDENGNEQVYETSEGIKEIEVPFKRSFWDWLFGRQLKGIYDYEIKSGDMGLNDFNNINEVSVLFEYKTDEGDVIETSVLDTGTTTRTTTTGGGSSGGDGGTTIIPCVPDKDCAYYYNLNQCGSSLSDGCANSLNCVSCINGTCVNGSCVELVNCTSDLNCSYLEGVCGSGLCNLTTNNCYVNYSIGNVCRNNISECDAVEYCINGLVDCPADVNESDGEICSEGSCFGGECVLLQTCFDGIKNQDESDIDCGGVCSGCDLGELCAVDNDCLSGNCSEGVCEEVTLSFPQDYVAYWKFDGDADDETGVNNGTWMGDDEIYSTGQVGQALEFDGDGDWVYLGEGDSMTEGMPELTISAWVKNNNVEADSVNGDIILGQYNVVKFTWTNTEDYSFSVRNEGGTWGVGISANTVTNTNWKHIVGTYNGSEVQLYIDTVAQDSTPGLLTGNTATITNDLYISSYTASALQSWNGSIDEVMIYDRALNESEIWQIFDAQEGIIVCANDTGCLTEGSFCDINTPYNCSFGVDGCLDRTNGIACDPEDTCENGECVPDVCEEVILCSNYTNFENCSADGCGVGGFLGCSWDGNICEDPCAGIDLCKNYTDSLNCISNGCGTQGYCVWDIVCEDFCEEINLCSDYVNSGNCTDNVCNVGVGCEWDGDSCEEIILPENAIYVDVYLAGNCIGNYSVAQRDCLEIEGDGDAYVDPQDAADIVEPGDTVYFREGVYENHEQTSYFDRVMTVLRSGSAGNPITFTNYNNEEVILSGNMPNDFGHYYTVVLGELPLQSSEISGAGIQNIIIDGLIIEGGHHYGLGIGGPADMYETEVDYTENIIIRNCIFRYNGVNTHSGTYGGSPGGGLRTAGKNVNVLIEDCEAYGNHGTSFRFDWVGMYDGEDWHQYEDEDDMAATQNSIIRNCLMYDNSDPENNESTDGISVSHVYNCTLENNIVFRNADDGMDIYSSIEVTIKSNIGFNNGDGYPEGDGDGNAIKFSAGGGGAHMVIENLAFNNDLFGFENSPPSSALLPYRPSKIYSNLAYGQLRGIFLGHYADLTYPGFDKSYLRNNLLLGNLADISGQVDGLVDSDYNFISRNGDLIGMQYIGQDFNSLTGEADLFNPEFDIDTNFGADWTLDEKMEHIRSQVRTAFSPVLGSQLIDNGTIVEGYHCATSGAHPGENCREWYGNAPDIGAYEYPETGMPSSNPFVQLLTWIKGLLTTKTGNAILNGKAITGNAVNETNENGKLNYKIPFIILSLLVVVILIIAVVIVKIKKNNRKSGKRRKN